MARNFKVTDSTGATVTVSVGTVSGAKIAAAGLGYKPGFTVEPVADSETATEYRFHRFEDGFNDKIALDVRVGDRVLLEGLSNASVTVVKEVRSKRGDFYGVSENGTGGHWWDLSAVRERLV